MSDWYPRAKMGWTLETRILDCGRTDQVTLQTVGESSRKCFVKGSAMENMMNKFEVFYSMIWMVLVQSFKIINGSLRKLNDELTAVSRGIMKELFVLLFAPYGILEKAWEIRRNPLNTGRWQRPD